MAESHLERLPRGETPRGDSWRMAQFLAVAAVCLSTAMQIRDGLIEPHAMLWLTAAIVTTALALFVPGRAGNGHAAANAAVRLLAVCVAAQFVSLFLHRVNIDITWETPPTVWRNVNLPGSWHGVAADRFFYAVLTAAAVLSTGILLRPQQARLFFVLVLVAFCLLGGWVIQHVPRPHMDVWMVQTESIKYALKGHNPFAAVYPDIYGNPKLYAPNTVRDGLVHQGFPYPPLVFLLDVPGYVLGGDFRYANLAAMALAGALIAFARPGRVAPLAAVVFLFTPRVLFVLESGWTEPHSCLWLAATVFAACRIPRLTAALFGLFVVSKQYLIYAIAPVWLLTRTMRQTAKTLLIGGIVGAAVSLPLALVDFKAFYNSNIGVAAGAEFRMDALSYLAWYANETGRIPSAMFATLVGFGVGFLATVLALWRAPRTPAGFAAAIALIYLLFFSFNKFGFCNYYYFLVGCLCCAAGAVAPLADARAGGFEAITAGQRAGRASEVNHA